MGLKTRVGAAGILGLFVGLGLAEGQASEAVPLSPQAFRDYAEGHTLFFENGGEAFGAETFLPGDRSVWRYEGGRCVAGTWRVRGAQICFLYSEGEDELCWRFLRLGERLVARLLGNGPDAGFELEVTGRDRAPVLCPGPGV
ncbi:MAG: hypothetical protein AAGC57_07585 [Pseudomonadota bacterium]